VSSAEDWIAWARRKAEAANGRPAAAAQDTADATPGQPPENPGPHATPTSRPASGGREGQEQQAAYSERQGNTGHPGPAPFAQHQGNREHWPDPDDEASPRRPGDPPWRSRIARRTSTPEAMAAFRDARLRRGWSLTRAAAETGVSRPHLSLLERGLRRPSESVAEDLISAYNMTGAEADAVSEVAVPWAGRDSPYRTGVTPGEW
jgi:hypothetical protein